MEAGGARPRPGDPARRLYYLDSSALVKLIVRETETAALRRFLRVRPGRVTSRLAAVEVLRAVRRSTAGAVQTRALRGAERVLAGTAQLAIVDDMIDRAGTVEPATLRSLDALHLAAALSLGDDLAGLITYDDRLAEAARAAGVTVHAPR